jgi:hypothetical protein
MIMWVITRSVNDYDQYGDYFECVFDHKPSLEELIHFFGDKNLAKHVLNGGGRRDFEHTWYFLTEMKSGVQYIHS